VLFEKHFFFGHTILEGKHKTTATNKTISLVESESQELYCCTFVQLYRQRYVIVSLSSSEKLNYCMSLWINVSAECPKCKFDQLINASIYPIIPTN
jgi:hypothetical protein